MSELPVGDNAKELLKSYIERVERLVEERTGINDDIKDVLAESKSNGFDVKTIRKMLAERKKTRETRLEERALFDTYAAALGLDDVLD